VQTNPLRGCLRHSKPQQLLHEHSSITYTFVELHEQGSLAMVYRKETELPLG